MRTTKRFGTGLAPALLVLLPALTSCGGDGGPSEPSPEASPSASPVEEGVPAELLSGFARLAVSGAENAAFLTFHSVDDGTEKAFLDLTALVSQPDQPFLFTHTEFGDLAFSPDFHRAAYATREGTVLVGELDADSLTYQVAAVVGPEEENTFGGGSITYESPQFSPDGTELWFEEHHEHGEEDSRVLAVPSSDPDSAPEERGRVPRGARAPHQFEGAAFNGRRSSTAPPDAAYVITPENELRVFTVHEGSDDGAPRFLTDGSAIIPWNFTEGPSGNFVGPLDSPTRSSLLTEAYTTVYSFDLSPDGTVSAREVLVENENEGIQSVWVDTDGGRYVILSGGAYYELPFESTGEPAPLFPELAFSTPVAEKSSGSQPLGVFPVQD